MKPSDKRAWIPVRLKQPPENVSDPVLALLRVLDNVDCVIVLDMRAAVIMRRETARLVWEVDCFRTVHTREVKLAFSITYASPLH